MTTVYIFCGVVLYIVFALGVCRVLGMNRTHLDDEQAMPPTLAEVRPLLRRS